MAIITHQWCGLTGDQGHVSYSYDDTVTSGFPHGKMTAFVWVNDTDQPGLVRMTLQPGVTDSDLVAGLVSSIPLAAASPVPTLSGETVMVADVSFTANASAAVGVTSLSVTPQVIDTLLLAGSEVNAPLPDITIPEQGGSATLPAFFGGGNVSSSGSLNLTNLGIPMQQVQGKLGPIIVPPAILGCAG